MRKLLWIALLVYSVVTTYMVKGYEKVNDKLNKANDTLLKSCVSTSKAIETDRY